MLIHDDQGWHLDKRISVAHILATLGFASALAGWMYALSDRVTINEQTINQNRAVVTVELAGVQAQLQAGRERDRELVVELNRNYQEILHRLERIEDGLNRHIESASSVD